MLGGGGGGGGGEELFFLVYTGSGSGNCSSLELG